MNISVTNDIFSASTHELAASAIGPCTNADNIMATISVTKDS